MSQVTVHYFNLKAVGEPIRLLLAYGGQEFVDHRIEKEDWPAFKPSTKFGQLPMLEMDGRKMSQSIGICRYLGHKYGLAGADYYEDFIIDEVMGFHCDIRSFSVKVYKEREKEREERKNKPDEEPRKIAMPLAALGKLHDIVMMNNGHLALGKLTWADFFFAGQYEVFKGILQVPDLSEKYPGFQKVVDEVLALPKVKQFVDNAPKTRF